MYVKKKNPKTNKGSCKSVDYETFVSELREALSYGLDMRTGKPYRNKMIAAAKACGLSEPTFWMRANQFISPEIYGELPKGFFNEKDRKDTKGNN